MQATHILYRSLVAAGMIAGFGEMPASGGVTEPAAAVFSSFNYVASASGPACDPVGSNFGGHLTWPGAAKLGAVWRFQPIRPSGPLVKTVTYPKTPKAGATHWSGTEHIVFEPGRETSTSTFEAVITYINAESFVMERTVTFTNCTQTVFSSFVLD
jgi:hypothetical protein